MILAVDVHYKNCTATAAGLLFESWKSNEVNQIITSTQSDIEPYQPGAFYKRELPCILSILKEIDQELDCILIDGYVTLGKDNADGLGMHLYNALTKTVPIIGVAKKAFENTRNECEIIRGKSKKPLFITSAGLQLTIAKELVSNMHGEHRLPTLIKLVDQVCRNPNSF